MSTLDAAARELAEVARNLREMGETGLKRELTDGIKHAAEQIEPKIRAGLIPHLPDPYAAVLDEDLSLSVSVRTGQADPGVFEVGRPVRRRRALGRLEDGVLGHPVFGMRSRTSPRRWAAWVYQTDGVRPGWFSDPIEAAAPQVRAEIEKVLDNVKDQIWRGVH